MSSLQEIMISSPNNEPDVRGIWEELHSHHDRKFGWRIYRIDYHDDELWQAFLRRLDALVDSAVSSRDNGEKIKAAFVWDVCDSPGEFDGASKSVIRQHFADWVVSTNGNDTSTRYTACIYADRESIEAVVNGVDPASDKFYSVDDIGAFVKILTRDFDELSATIDEGYPEVEGCRLEDVGWMKVAASLLFHRLYALLSNDGWYDEYVRPPRTFNDDFINE